MSYERTLVETEASTGLRSLCKSTECRAGRVTEGSYTALDDSHLLKHVRGINPLS